MNYGVNMEQGVSANLIEHTLITGHGEPEHKLMSCSAVMFVNTITWRGGLYHFPEGSINGRDGALSRAILQRMEAEINPTEIHIRHGPMTSMSAMMGGFPQMSDGIV